MSTKNNNNLWDILAELKEHKWVDLTHGFGADTPRWPGFKPEEIETLFNLDEHGIFVNKYSFPGQYGTHLDAPGHFSKGKRLVEEIELKELVLPLVVIDASEKVKKNADYELTVEDILEWEKEHGTIPEGSFVAFRSDWSKRWPDQETFLNQDENGNSHYPGWDLEALKFLYETRKIKASGHEPFDTDAPVKQKVSGFIGENYILSNNFYQIEVLANLDQIPAVGSIIFSIVPKAKQAPGFPVRSFAIIAE